MKVLFYEPPGAVYDMTIYYTICHDSRPNRFKK